MKRQASYHGEIGANGRAYKKGQFIAEQVEYQSRGRKAKKGLGKQEVSPYVWEIPPDEEMKSIYRFIQGVFGDLKSGEINLQAIEFHKEDVKKIKSLMLRYQNGERWYYPNQETYI